MNDRELLEFIAAQVGTLTSQVGTLTNKIDGIEKKVEIIETEVKEIKTSQIKLEIIVENDIKPKLEALFDGHKQNTDQLERIENEVVRHEEFIIKRVK